MFYRFRRRARRRRAPLHWPIPTGQLVPRNPNGAMHKAHDIFPNLNGSEAEDYVEGSMEDPDAFWEGEGFTDGGEEDEWEDWVGNEAL